MNPAVFTRALAQPRDFLTRFIGVLLVFVAVLLIGYAELAQHRFVTHQTELAQRAVAGTAELIELYLSDAERTLELFAQDNAETLGRLAHAPEDSELYDRLLDHVLRHFPDAFAMALADAQGNVLVDDFGGRVEAVCRRDIREFARSEHPHEVVVHPNPLGYHIDLMVPVTVSDGWQGIFFVSLSPERIAQILAESSPPGHRLFLIHRDRKGLIEISAEGSRNQLQRAFVLSPEEMASVLATRSLPGTRWELVDVVSPGLLATFGKRERLHAFVVFAGFLGVALFLAHLVRREERGRTQAEEALIEANRQLDARVRERTRELRQANDALHREIDRRRQTERALQQALERYDLAVRGSNDAIWDWDLETDDVYLSPRFAEIRGLPPEAATLRLEAWLEDVHVKDALRLREAFAKVRDTDQTQLCEEVRVRTAGGGWRWCMIRGAVVRDREGRAQRVAGSITDVTERRRAAEALQRYALYDPLTGMPNQALFLDRLAQALRESDAELAVLVLHVEGLRDLNQRMGRATADELLRRLGQRLATLAEGTETLARISGSEFAWLIPQPGVHRVPERIARVESAMAEPFETPVGEALQLQVRMGWTLRADVAGDAEALLRAADAAMLQARKKGRLAERFDPGVEDAGTLHPRRDPVSQLREAIEQGELRLHYQPLVRLSDGQPYGFEALVRWAHPEQGMLAPAEFITVAEESGLIVHMGEWVLREALGQCRAWRERGTCPVVMSVNLSCHQFLDPDFVGRVEEALAANRDAVDAGCLTLFLEITETTLMQDMDLVLSAVRRLRSWGVRFAIDDFGTGYSSLAYLQALPLDTLKLDQGFVARLEEEGTRRIVAHLVSLAHELSMQVVAEGIETGAQCRQLVEMGVDIGQGYWFGRPMASHEAWSWWEQHLHGTQPEGVT